LHADGVGLRCIGGTTEGESAIVVGFPI